MAEPAKKEMPTKVAEAKSEKRRVDVLGLLIFLLVVINLASVGGLAYFIQQMWFKVQTLQATTQKLTKPDEESPPPLGKELGAPSMGLLVPLEGFLVNLTSDQGPKFLQTQMELELSEPAVEEELGRKRAAVRDAIIVLLSSRSYKELKEPGGLKKLRQNMLNTINGLLSTGKVKDIYFTQFHFN